MMPYLRLIRFQNLLIIAMTQYFMRLFIIAPLLKTIKAGIEYQYGANLPHFVPQFREDLFLLLVLATVFITAAGYVINDYFDTKTDMLNRPGTVIVGKAVTRRIAMIMHIFLSMTGILIGFFLAYKIHRPWIGSVFVIVAGLLWFYSTTYKRQLLIGNLIVALMTAMVPFMVVLFELPILNRVYGQLVAAYNTDFSILLFWILGFSFFAFMTTLVREIIKDIEDFRGDKAYGRHSLPVVLGVSWSKCIVVILQFITLLALLLIYHYFLRDKVTLFYILLGLVLPICLSVYFLVRARQPSEFGRVSMIMKMIMLAGICYAVVANHLINAQISAA